MIFQSTTCLRDTQMGHMAMKQLHLITVKGMRRSTQVNTTSTVVVAVAVDTFSLLIKFMAFQFPTRLRNTDMRLMATKHIHLSTVSNTKVYPHKYCR